jgi:hypothetical protein
MMTAQEEISKIEAELDEAQHDHPRYHDRGQRQG